jgi:hypothetical protein
MPLVTFKQFLEMQPDNFDTSEAHKAYSEYKDQHLQRQKNVFFAEHMNEHWFREKYDPYEWFKWKSQQI